MFIPMWLMCVIGILVLGEIWTLHNERGESRKALEETQQELDETKQELEQSAQQLEEIVNGDADDED